MCSRAWHVESLVPVIRSQLVCGGERCCRATFSTVASSRKRPAVDSIPAIRLLHASGGRCTSTGFLCCRNHSLLGVQSPFLTSTLRNITVSSAPLLPELKSVIAALPPIPEPPSPATVEQLEAINNIVGNKLEYLGLGNYTPSGFVQVLLCYIHDSLGVPWWQGIMICTTLIRLGTLPVMVASQRNSASMGHMTKGMQEINDRLLDAKRRKDAFQQQLVMLEMQEYMKEKGAMRLYLRTVGISFVQGFIFLTYFYALRGMSMAPLLSLTQSGFLWVTDLTLPDPTLILPMYSALTIGLIMELGIETGVSTASMSKFKWIMRLVPFGLFFFIKGFPSALLLHWATSNTISLFVAIAFQVPALRKALKVPPLPAGSIFDKFRSLYSRVASKGISSLVPEKPKKSLKQQWRDFYDSYFMATGPSSRSVRENDERRFANAGKFAPPPTFPYNPREKFGKEFEASERSFFSFFMKRRKHT